MASKTPQQTGIIPLSVRALLAFHVRGYYKQTINETNETASSRYIRSLERVVDDLKEVVSGLYREREKASRRLKDFIEKWEVYEEDPSSLSDPSEYVAGL